MRSLIATAVLLALAGTALGQARVIPNPTKDYMRQLARPGQFVLVVEYFDPKLNAAVDRLGLVSKTPFTSQGLAEIKASDTMRLILGGIKPCASTEPISYEDYQGSCADLARYGLDQITRNARVLICRAYLDQKGKAAQEVACFAYTNFPGALESVDPVEATLVAQGMAFVARGVDGKPERPDLVSSEELARSQRLALWSMNPVPKPAGAP
jgi:endonuclease YncB( thermonuclease family)